MTKHSAAKITGVVAVGLLLASAMLYIGYYGSVKAHVTDDFQPVVAAVWLACAINMVLVAAVVLRLRSMEGGQHQFVLFVLALNPLSLAVLQFVYRAPWPPVVPLLLAALAILATANLGSTGPQLSLPAA
jgi:hypothetical protein